MSATTGPRRAAVMALMLASGFAGLGYQIVWTQQSALWMGHETAGVLAVVAAFFGGLAVGAVLLGRRIAASHRPGRWYAGCELLIGLWSLVLALAMAPIGQALLQLIGAEPTPAWQWGVAFGGSFLLLLPATAAMGATLPAMERALAQHWRGGAIAALYAGNTFGAVLGVLASAFWLVPAIGLARTALVCATLNLLCAAAALWLLRGSAPAEPQTAPRAERGLRSLLAATGFLGIGYEVLVVRVLSQVAENTVYTFALLLAVYLVGSAAGAAAYDRWLARRASAARLGERLPALLALACLAGTASLWGAEALKAQALAWWGPGMPAALAAEAVLAAVAFLPPTLLMGALFSHLAIQARAAGIGFGRALGINTLAAAAAPLVFGLLLLPALGAKAALLLVAAGYLLLAWPAGRPRGVALPAGIGAAALAMALAAPPLAFVELPEGARVLSYREGAMAAVSVVEEADGTRRLRINNRQQEGSNAAWSADARQALLPLLLHPAPHQALFLGLGTGTTASAATLDPGLQVQAVELLPEVIAAAPWFAAPQRLPTERLHTVAADARRFVRASQAQYDLIVSDNFHPARSGSAALYTVEHFQAVRARLAAGGLFCQWLPLHQLDLPTLRSIVRAFATAFPDGGALLATLSLETPVLGLVGHADGGRFDLAQLQARAAAARHWPRSPAGLGLDDAYAVLGTLVAGPQALQRLAAGAPANTDDHPIVAYLAPRATYAPAGPPRERLGQLMAALSLQPQELVDADPAAAARLAAYWDARTRFLAAGRGVQPSADVRRMLAQVQQPLLEVLRTSADFRPAYDPLLQMAAALARVDAPAARDLLDELVRLQPARPEAGELLRRLPS
ncbi:fused MFS/spermidine synthase [Pseudorhodoferax sp.]|uniref:fused MFS/spermidine synthase n=1 Tax=Pseudorhodoferax sp. TaxID=1993553 RepID=UPI002DD69EC1|nr:fused MFS/spermidine synthase [Pseudorhodoferax sp.]